MERLQTRIGEVSLPDAKQRLDDHLQESLEHQKILQQLISNIGGQPTQEKLSLPLPSYPQSMKEMMDKTMTKPEYELKRAEEDMIEQLLHLVETGRIDPTKVISHTMKLDDALKVMKDLIKRKR